MARLQERTSLPVRAPKTKARARKAESLARLKRELTEARERQFATSEVLKVISSSPGELKPVFESMLANAMRICESQCGFIYQMEAGAMRAMAEIGVPPAFAEYRRQHAHTGGATTPVDEMRMTKKPAHVHDARASDAYRMGNPNAVAGVDLGGARTVLYVPMLKEDEIVGVINVYRQEVRPFADDQIALLENFAAQAVIAIENARLLNELRQRTGDLSEALEQQTATSEVLSVISGSPGELKPVFDAMLENATRICGAKFGNLCLYQDGALHMAAAHNTPPALVEARQRMPFQADARTPAGRVIKTKQVVHIADLMAEKVYLERDPVAIAAVELGGVRSLLLVPMLKEQELIGTFHIFRQEVRPFTDKQIELVKNFAAQAVIAIENARLLNELRQRTDDLSEALEQQTATSEVLGVISSSPGELEPVFEAMLANATRICEAKFGILFLSDGDAFRTGAIHNAPPALIEARRREPLFRPAPVTALGQVVRTKRTAQVTDMLAEQGYFDVPPGYSTPQIANLAGARTAVAVPMLKEDELVGAFVIYRQEVRPFSDKQIELLTNFAAQAVIAIENTRLLNELRQRTDDLTEALEQQTATSEVLQVISSSPGELEPVFEAMLANATRICEAKFGTLFACEDGRSVGLSKLGYAARNLPSFSRPDRYRPGPQPDSAVSS